MPRPVPTREQLTARFFGRVKPENGCWLWLGYKDRDGYGVFYTKEGNRAHRLSYIFFCGPIAEGMHVLHKCDNPSCVNPEHLFLGTNQDNIDDKMVKGRHRWKPRTKLTEENVNMIRTSDLPNKELAELFSVDPSQISRIKTGRRWSNANPKMAC